VESFSSEPQPEYFADGLTEELITELAQIMPETSEDPL
jgi:TolB-like protein